MELNEKALEAATDEIPVYVKREARKEIAETTVRAYLEAATPPDVAGLVRKIDAVTNRVTCDFDSRDELLRQAATALRLSAGGGWRTDVENAPPGESVLLATTGGHVGEAIAPEDISDPDDGWFWAGAGFISPKHKPIAWQPLPASPTVEAGHVE